MFAHIVTYHQIYEKVNVLTYRIPKNFLKIQRGSIVSIPFGRIITRGIIIDIVNTCNLKTIKDILDHVDRHIQISFYTLELCKKLSHYYNCPLYKFIKLFLPKDILLGSYTTSQIPYIFQGSKWENRNELVQNRAYKQKEILEIIEQYNLEKGLEFKKYFSKLTKQDFNPLIKKEILEIKKIENLKAPSLSYIKKGKSQFSLNDEQKIAIKEILINKTKPHLLFGITGSGKTEVYMRLIQNILMHDEKSQIIMLVPEINLTPQTVSRFLDYFENISLWHSRLSKQEKLDEWTKIYRGKSRIIIGSRSALFTPVQNLKAIILDEEHDKSFKQEKSPKYDVHTIAKYMQKQWKCHLILGSATPKLETFYHSNKSNFQKPKINKNYEISTLQNRFTKLKLPDVSVIDMKQERLEKGSVLSYPLQLAINQVLEKKEQVILFLNRRGFSPLLICKTCGWNLKCPSCDISATYHVYGNRSYLQCHCCGQYFKSPHECANCHGNELFPIGVGTQRLETELSTRYPNSKILRVDYDTTRTKNAHKEIYEKIESGNVDIIIGTQMISKGLDIGKVSLVGIILADYGLHVPDFRAEEYSYQLLSQVAGRAGRHIEGKVILQTFSPDNKVIKHMQKHDYEGLQEKLLKDRKDHFYPPFSLLLKLDYAHFSLDKCKQESNNLVKILKKYFENEEKIEIIGPSPDFIVKRANRYHYHILIKHLFTEKKIQKLFSIIPKDWIIDRNPYRII
jgi:primosomal protein N' (replication factor Y)